MDFQKKLQMPRVLFGAGMLVAFIGFLLPITKINKSYFEEKQTQYEREAAKYADEARRQNVQAEEEKLANGETSLYGSFKSAAERFEKKEAGMKAKADNVLAKIESITVNEADKEKADAIVAKANEKAEAILAAAEVKVAALEPKKDDPAVENKIENIQYNAEEKADSLVASAEAIASNLTDGAKTVNVVTAGVVLNRPGIAFLSTFLWVACLAALAGVVVYVLTHAIVFDYLCWLIGCAFGIASVVATTAEFNMNVFAYSGCGAYVVFIGMTTALAGLVLDSMKTKK